MTFEVHDQNYGTVLSNAELGLFPLPMVAGNVRYRVFFPFIHLLSTKYHFNCIVSLVPENTCISNKMCIVYALAMFFF